MDVIPEAVSVESEQAGLGSRFVAGFVDGMIQGGFLLVLAIALSGAQPSPETTIILWLIGVFLVLWIYPSLFEAAWAGQSPGKRAARIRVVMADGRPVVLPAVLIRNLLRIVDLLPGLYFIGAISILVTKHSQRLGDLAAGTLVVHEGAAATPEQLVLAPSDRRMEVARTLDVAGLSPREYAVVRTFLLRRDALAGPARTRLAVEMAGRLRGRVHGPADVDPETLLEAVLVAYREARGS